MAMGVILKRRKRAKLFYCLKNCYIRVLAWKMISCFTQYTSKTGIILHFFKTLFKGKNFAVRRVREG